MAPRRPPQHTGAMAEHPAPVPAPADPDRPVALVTGAAHGLGLEVAAQLARLGTDVLVGARDPDRAASAVRGLAGVEALPWPLDITDQDSVDRAVRTVETTRGRLDVLVNNAAAHPDHGAAVTVPDLEAAARTVGVDLIGTWRMTVAALPLLERSPRPRVVNVGSGAGSRTDPRYGTAVSGGGHPAHALGKAAVHALTGVLAAGLADSPVVVNAVCPGFTATVPGAREAGARDVAESAPGVVWAATLPDDGPRGGLFRDGEPLGW